MLANDFWPIAGLFIVSLFLAGQVNRAIYRLAWHARPIGPWSAPHPQAPARVWSDRIPVWGWLGLERESTIHGRGFWIRPLLIELSLAIGIVALYLVERSGGLVPSGGLPSLGVIHAQFAAHGVLILLMTAATFIDVDEKMIPDSITVNGTLAGLLFAIALPHSLLPLTAETSLMLTTPQPWDPRLDGPTGLWLGLGIFWGWSIAIVPKTIWFRGGLLRGLRYLVSSTLRIQGNVWYLLIAVLGSVAIVGTWIWGGAHWQALLTSLAGLCVGGGVVWAVRIVAGRALRREAMGFGDVTLMAMIGSFVGWQPALMIFFLAPFAGAIIAIDQYLMFREAEIAYGPFLCVATLVVLVGWPSAWLRWGPIFQLGAVLPAVLIVCLGLMGVMLVGWRMIRGD